MPLPTDRSTSNTAAEHVADHNTIHAAVNGIGTTGVLGYVGYAGGSDTNYTLASTSFADVDATNLVVTFTAPASGKVLVRLVGYGAMNAATNCFYNVRDSGGDVAGSSGLAASMASGHYINWMVVVTGLTGGNSYTWKWGYKVASSSMRLFHGPNNGKLWMVVESAP